MLLVYRLAWSWPAPDGIAWPVKKKDGEKPNKRFMAARFAGQAAAAQTIIPLMDDPGGKKHRAWNWLLILPGLGLLFPAIYARATPALFGFPFFYWYQFAWVFVTAAITGLVFVLVKD